MRSKSIGALTAEVPVSYPEVQGTEALGGYDPGPVLEVREHLLQHVVHRGAEGKVVHEHYGGGGDPLPVLFLEEVALEKKTSTISRKNSFQKLDSLE